MAIDETELRTRMRKLVASGELLTDAVGRARRYLADADDRPVAPTAGAVAALERFSEPLPASVGDASEILAMLDEVGSPGTVAQTGARFFGLVNGGMIPTAHAARVLADAWDQNAAVGAVSPTNAAIEETCQAWLRDLFGLPEHTVAGFVSGTSLAIVCGLG